MTTIKKVATISITAEPRGRTVWLIKDGDMKYIASKPTIKEAIVVARDLAIELGAVAGLSNFNEDAAPTDLTVEENNG